MKDHFLDSNDLTWLSGLARALLGEAHAADDLVQETAIAAIEGPIPSEAPRRAWLASVARRLAARRVRSETRRSRREEGAARPEALPDSAELVEKAEIAEHVTAAARRLPEPYRRTILLRFLEGLGTEEIAEREGKPADTVRWRVRRGLELLREELVQRHDRDWSSWSVLLLPLARSNGDVGLATAGASGVLSSLVVSTVAMKVTLAAVAVLGCAGLWNLWSSGERSEGDPRVAALASPPGIENTSEIERVEAQTATLEPDTGRAAVVDPAPAETLTAEAESSDLFGTVVDEAGDPIPDATVYLIPAAGAGTKGGPVHARTASDWQGAFRFAVSDWQSARGEGSRQHDLGVVANGYLRTVVPDLTEAKASGGVTVVLERGRTLGGRVVDESGRPVPDLELVAFTAFAGVSHVSPSQRLLRAERRRLAGAASDYEQCRATTDGRGEVEFTGLPPGELQVLPLDPGWVITDQSVVEAVGEPVVWIAKRCLGVRLIVVDSITGRPVERASATFGFEATFLNGEVTPFEQWVGRGAGEVSFVLGPELIPGLEERTITRAVFYGTVRAGENGEVVSWTAEPIEDVAGAAGVVDVRVEVERADPVTQPVSQEVPGEEPESAKLVLDVRYDDFAPFEGELVVRWSSDGDPDDVDKALLDPVELGRYELEVTAGTVTLEAADRFASGSLPWWNGEVLCRSDRESLAIVTLPRGGTATITRPEGWSGEWFVQGSWRSSESEPWRGSLGYSTDDARLTLTVLRPAEWRFELRRNSAVERDPLVRTAIVKERETVVVRD